MKTKEEMNAIKEEVENLNKELRELTEEELAQVTGGVMNRKEWENFIISFFPGLSRFP